MVCAAARCSCTVGGLTARYCRTECALAPRGDDGTVKSEEKRDQNTLAIGTSLAVFVLIVIVGAIALSLLGLSFDAYHLPLYAVAGAAMVVYLARTRAR